MGCGYENTVIIIKRTEDRNLERGFPRRGGGGEFAIGLVK